eukprot:scaffold5787_cov179-Ochromonas_danica.AAC.3
MASINLASVASVWGGLKEAAASSTQYYSGKHSSLFSAVMMMVMMMVLQQVQYTLSSPMPWCSFN